MNASIFGLVLLSAALHVAWNTLAKTSRDKRAFAWLTCVGGAAALGLVEAGLRLAAPAPLPAAIWLLAFLSGLAQAAYLALLFAAYAASDLSMVYPLCRGLPPLFLLLAAGRLVGDTVSPAQAVAVGCIVAGTIAVGMTNRDVRGAISPRGILLAAVTAMTTAAYSLIDRAAMAMPGAPSAMEYLFLSYLFLAPLFTLFMACTRPRFRGGLAELRRNGRAVAAVSVLSPLAYWCIVAALAHGNVVLITAVRNVGILLSALTGFLFLHERASLCRVSGVGLVCLGVTALALA